MKRGEIAKWSVRPRKGILLSVRPYSPYLAKVLQTIGGRSSPMQESMLSYVDVMLPLRVKI